MIQFKVRETWYGGHADLIFFTRKLPTETWANIGTLRMTQEDAAAFRSAFKFHEWDKP